MNISEKFDNSFLSLTAEEIEALYKASKEPNRFSKGVKKSIKDAWYFLVFQVDNAEKHFPKTDSYGDMVIMHHEGICHQCGCGILVQRDGDANPMGQYATKGYCRNGHKTYAVPSEDGLGDWLAY